MNSRVHDMKKLFVLLFVVICGSIWAQDFGFGFDDTAESTGAGPVSVKISGEIGAEFLGFVHDFKTKEKARVATLGDVLSGALNFSASGANVDAYIGFNLSASAFRDLANISSASPNYTPLILDEAYLRAYIGPVNIEAGLRKLTWGRADSLGPLDVVNPLDYTDLTNITDIMSIKIARPMVHVSWNMDGFSKLEGVFIPNFTGHRFADKGRWMSSQVSSVPDLIKTGIKERIYEKLDSGLLLQLANSTLFDPNQEFYKEFYSGLESNLMNYFNNYEFSGLDTGGLEYFQAGLRFSTTVKGIDFGAQYFYGNLFRPSYSLVDGIDALLMQINNNFDPTPPPSVDFDKVDASVLFPKIYYNRYHQFGIDYAQVLFDFNIRAEAAFHLTEDYKGDNGAIVNPFIGWSLGFDRDIVWGINANIQCNETVRLLDSKVGENPVLDIEADTKVTSTRFTMRVAKSFLRDNLETKVTAIWDLENSDCYIIPGITWTVRDFTADLSAGIFAGKESGELGQYWRNSFISLGIKYSF